MGRNPDAPLAGPSYRCFRRARRPRRAAASSRPGGRESRRRRSAACEGVFFSNQKNTPSRFPRKIVRGDGVVTSSISLAAAQRAPAHSFRCSSFSHRKTLRWEPCISPLTTPLKRPKERPAGLSFGNLLGVGRRAGLRGTVGRGTRDGGGVRVGSFRGFRLGGDEVEESLVVLAPGLGGWGPAGDGGRHAVPRAWPPPTKFRPGIWGVGQVVVPYGWLRGTSTRARAAPCAERVAGQIRGLPDE